MRQSAKQRTPWKRVSMQFRRVPPGAFWMGATEQEVQRQIEASLEVGNSRHDAERWYRCQLPRHRVDLDGYWIGRYPVTVSQFAIFVEETAYTTTAECLGHGSIWNEACADWVEVGHRYASVMLRNWVLPDDAADNVGFRVCAPCLF